MAQRIFGKAVSPQIKSPEPIAPAPIQSSTFVQAPRRSGVGGNAMRLADSFAKLNGDLRRFGQQEAARSKANDHDEEEEFRASTKDMTPAEIAAALADPKNKSWSRRKYLGIVQGEHAANDAMIAWTEHVSTLPSGADITEELEKFRLGIAQGFGEDHAASAAFMDGTAQWAMKIRSGQLQESIDNYQNTRNKSLVAGMNTEINEGMESGANAQQIANGLFSRNERNAQFLNMTSDERDAVLFTVAQAASQNGNPDLVRAILHTAQGNGWKVADNPRYTNNGISLMDAAVKAQAANRKEATAETWPERELAIREGRFDPVQDKIDNPHYTARERATAVNRSNIFMASIKAKEDELLLKERFFKGNLRAKQSLNMEAAQLMSEVDGKLDIEDRNIMSPTGKAGGVKMSKEDQIEGGTEVFLEELNTLGRQMKNGGASDEQINSVLFAKKLGFMVNNAVVDEEWEGKLTNIAMKLSPGFMDSGEPIPQEVIESLNVYREIALKNPAYADSLIKDDASKKFFTALHNQLQYGPGSGPERLRQSVALAVRVSNMSNEEQSTHAARRVDIKEKLAGVNAKWFWRSHFEDWELNEYDTNRLSIMVETASLSNPTMPLEDVVTQQAEKFKNTNMSINGRLVPINVRNQPTGFKGRTEEIIQETFDKMSDADRDLYNVADASQIAIREVATHPGEYVMFSKEEGTVISSAGTINKARVEKQTVINQKVDEKEAAAWGMTKEAMGRVSVAYVFEPGEDAQLVFDPKAYQVNVGGVLGSWLNGWMHNKGYQPEDITEKQATEWMDNHRRNTEVHAFIEAKAKEEDMVLIDIDDKPVWVNYETGQPQRVSIKWSKDHKEIRFDPMGDIVKRDRQHVYRRSIWRNTGILTHVGRGKKYIKPKPGYHDIKTLQTSGHPDAVRNEIELKQRHKDEMEAERNRNR